MELKQRITDERTSIGDPLQEACCLPDLALPERQSFSTFLSVSTDECTVAI